MKVWYDPEFNNLVLERYGYLWSDSIFLGKDTLVRYITLYPKQLIYVGKL